MDLLKTSQTTLRTALQRGQLVVEIVGIGRIGLPLATMMTVAGTRVYGVTKTPREARAINHGNPMFHEPGLNKLLERALETGRFKATSDTRQGAREADAIIICVGTPIDKRKRPDLRAVLQVCNKVAEELDLGKLVILRSTVPPGFTNNVVRPLLERVSGLSSSGDFGLTFCPERLVEGQALQELVSVPQIVGGVNRESCNAAARLFTAMGARVVKASSASTAEMAKLFDNIYRDVNIALANELALVCEHLDIDIMEVTKVGNTGPRTRVLIPGSGTGGSCLNKDPYILLNYAARAGASPILIPAARMVNEMMPMHTVRRVREALKRISKPLKGARVAVLGLSFKRDTDDFRGSVAEPIIRELKRLGAHVVAYDPLVKPADALRYFESEVSPTLRDASRKADCLVFLTDHEEFRNLDLDQLAGIVNNPAAIVDGRQVIDPEEAVESRFLFLGIGR